jgi:hypothetical protein
MLSSELCTPSIKFLSPSNCLILLLFTWFVSSKCDVAHNDDGSCKIFPPLFCFLLDNPTYGKSHYIQQISSKRYRCPDIAFIGRGNDFPLSPHDRDCVSHILRYYLFPLCSVMFWRSLFVLLFFFLRPLCVLFSDSDYPFLIFKLFFEDPTWLWNVEQPTTTTKYCFFTLICA